jgi:hypothetical protein
VHRGSSARRAGCAITSVAYLPTQSMACHNHVVALAEQVEQALKRQPLKDGWQEARHSRTCTQERASTWVWPKNLHGEKSSTLLAGAFTVGLVGSKDGWGLVVQRPAGWDPSQG